MYKDQPFGLFKFGYIEDLEKINGKNLYEYYKELIQNCKIDIFISGIIDDKIKQEVQQNESINNLQDRNANYIAPNIKTKPKTKNENIVTESMEVTQGKLILGLDVNSENEEQRYETLIYNTILGGTANSKMFQNVREKEHLAYVAGSSYLHQKDNIFINVGIEIENYEKALEITKKQIEDMKKGDFSEEDIENSKKGIIATIKTIDDEQHTELTYYFGQELSLNKTSIDEYIENIQKVNKEDIIKVAQNVSINTIYFLKN